MNNLYNVKKVKYRKNVHCKCPLGNDWCTYKVKVTVKPKDEIADYCNIDNFIMTCIDGKEMILEQAVHEIKKFIETQYTGSEVKVKGTVKDAVHGKATVTV